MNKKRILVLTDHMPWGHRSIAKAIYGYLKEAEKNEGFNVFYEEVRAELGIGDDIYTFLCRYMPSTSRFAYKLASSVSEREMVMTDIAKRSLPGLKKVIEKIKPDLVISCYFLHSHALADWRDEFNLDFKLWSIVADPRSIVPGAFVPRAELNLVYDEVGFNLGKKWGIPEERMMMTGWWTRGEMFKAFDRKKIRQKLGFNDDRPVIFVGGGSLGTSSLTSFLPALMLVKNKVGLVFNTGTDRLAFNLVEEYVRLFKKVRKNDLVQIKNLGWIENMAEVLAGCDLVFGKAGPNFLLDVVAREIPFVAITHIGGQEDGNLEMIVEKKLGWVREKFGSAGRLFLEYVNDPDKYKGKFKESLHRESEKNRQSLPKILGRIREEMR